MDEIRIILSDGTSIPVNWCGVNPATQGLSVQMYGRTEEELAGFFSDPARLTEIIYEDTGRRRVYYGYTKYDGVLVTEDGTQIVSLLNPVLLDQTEVIG